MRLRSLILALFAGLIACQSPLLAQGEERAARRPNVVLIMADDLGYGELGSYGQKKIRTPHLDRLAAQGIRLTQAYSAAPLCAPTRCSLMTGRHTGKGEIRGNRDATKSFGPGLEGQHPLSAEAFTIAEALKANGYRTGLFGKWGLGHPDSTGAPNAQGFDEFCGLLCQRIAHSFYPSHLWRNGERILINERAIPGHQRQPEGQIRIEDWVGERYAPDVWVEASLSFIERHQAEPFFIYLPLTEPHVALQPPVDLVATYPLEWDPKPYRGQCGYTPHPRPRAAYAALISALDRHVGKVMKTLERLGLEKDTLIIFLSDNGPTHGSNGDPDFGVGGVDTAFFESTAGLRGFKGGLFEGGIRVPFLFAWPQVLPAGAVSDQVLWIPDLFPTILEATQTEIAEEQRALLDGLPLFANLRNQKVQAREKPLIFVSPEYGGQVAVRMGSMKVLRTGIAGKNPSDWMVFDLEADPFEAKDLSGQRQDLVSRAKDLLKAEVQENALFPMPIERILRER